MISTSSERGPGVSSAESSAVSSGVAPAAVSPLQARLGDPAERVPLADLPDRWFRQRVELLVAGHAAAVDDPALTGRLRGAWGRALMAGASAEALAGGPCPWDPPCALDPLFRDQGAITARLSVPKPYVLSARAYGADLLVALTLFGFACDWVEAAADALVAGLRHGAPPPLGRPAVPLGRRIVTEEAVPVPDADAGPAVLVFHTPVAFRSGAELTAPNPRTLISGLGNRVSGLARWLDTGVEADWRALAEHADTLHADVSGLRLAAWSRRSARQEGRAIPLGGWHGRMILSGDLDPVLPLLALGATCHAGSHAALGLGAYTLAMAG